MRVATSPAVRARVSAAPAPHGVAGAAPVVADVTAVGVAVRLPAVVPFSVRADAPQAPSARATSDGAIMGSGRRSLIPETLATGAQGQRRRRSATIAARHPLEVDRLVVQLGIDPLGERNLAQRPSRLGRLLHDLGGPVVSDGAVESGGHGEGGARRGVGAGPVDLDYVDALVGEHAAG